MEGVDGGCVARDESGRDWMEGTGLNQSKGPDEQRGAGYRDREAGWQVVVTDGLWGCGVGRSRMRLGALAGGQGAGGLLETEPGAAEMLRSCWGPGSDRNPGEACWTHSLELESQGLRQIRKLLAWPGGMDSRVGVRETGSLEGVTVRSRGWEGSHRQGTGLSHLPVPSCLLPKAPTTTCAS